MRPAWAASVPTITPNRLSYAKTFLAGKSRQVMEELSEAMQTASAELAFERAAALRDQISALQRLAEQQDINGEAADVDVLGIAQTAGINCVQLMMIRDGRVLGSRAYFPKLNLDESPADVLQAFVGQYYIGNAAYRCPPQILLSEAISEAALIGNYLSGQSGRKVALLHKLRGRRARWIKMAVNTGTTELSKPPGRQQRQCPQTRQPGPIAATTGTAGTNGMLRHKPCQR